MDSLDEVKKISSYLYNRFGSKYGYLIDYDDFLSFLLTAFLETEPVQDYLFKFLYNTGRNLFLKEKRRSKKNSEKELDQLQRNSKSMESKYSLNRKISKIIKGYELLTKYEKKLFELYFVKELTITDIAKQFTCSRGKISRQIERIKLLLAQKK